MKNYTCKDCECDITDYSEPIPLLECDAGGIPDKVFERFRDNELPEHCGQFKLKGEIKNGDIS